MSLAFSTSEVFASDGWLEFNRQKWGLTPERLRLTKENKDLPALETVLYLTKQGRVRMPPTDLYLPARYTPTPTTAPARLIEQWMSIANHLLAEFKKRNLDGAVSMPPQMRDVRPWQWDHFNVNVGYTYYIPFPFRTEDTNERTRLNILKATDAGFSCRRASQLEDALLCLKATDERPHVRLEWDDLDLMTKSLGKETFRCYVCYAPNGEPAATCIVLNGQDGNAVVWASGTRRQYIGEGAESLLRSHLLDDLMELGAKGVDLMSANSASRSQEKRDWNPKVLPYYSISRPGLGSAAKIAWNAWRFHTHR